MKGRDVGHVHQPVLDHPYHSEEGGVSPRQVPKSKQRQEQDKGKKHPAAGNETRIQATQMRLDKPERKGPNEGYHDEVDHI
jgi:hypothetical protein